MSTLATTHTLILPGGSAVPFSTAQFPSRHHRHFSHHWLMRWSVPAGQAYRQETLPQPVLHLCVESGPGAEHRFAYAQGVVTRRFVRTLHGSGRVFGTKLLPGALPALTASSIAASSLRDRVVPLRELLGAAADELFVRLESADDDASAALADELWAPLLKPLSPELELLQTILRAIETDRSLTKVDDVVSRFGVSKRELQRWFLDAVGVPPKNVLARARLQDALLRLADTDDDITGIAHELGYADAAHFSRDFKAAIGLSPSTYRRGARSRAPR